MFKAITLALKTILHNDKINSKLTYLLCPIDSVLVRTVHIAFPYHIKGNNSMFKYEPCPEVPLFIIGGAYSMIDTVQYGMMYDITPLPHESTSLADIVLLIHHSPQMRDTKLPKGG